MILSQKNYNKVIKETVAEILQIVGQTFGPKGGTVIVSNGLEVFSTKDGISVLEALIDSYPIEKKANKAIAELIKQCSKKTAGEVGDGTTSTIIFLASLLADLARLPESTNKNVVQKSMHEAYEDIKRKITDFSRKIESKEDIFNIAKISSNNDDEIGRIIADAYDSIGKNGTITFQESNQNFISLEIRDGYSFNSGFASVEFCNVKDKQLCQLTNPLILVSDESFIDVNKYMRIFDLAITSIRPLVIISDSIEGQMLKACLATNAKANAGSSVNTRMCIIQPPGFGVERYDSMRDIAAACGATFIQKGSDFDWDKLKLSDFGSATSIEIGKYHTNIVDPQFDEVILKERQEYLKDAIQQEPSMDICLSLQSRLARLSSSIAVIKVGGNTYAEMIENKHRIEDAINAVHSCFKMGFIAGAGSTGVKLAYALGYFNLENNSNQGYSHPGYELTLKTCLKPFELLVKDASAPTTQYYNSELNSFSNHGYDAYEEEWVDDLFSVGIIEPTNGFLSALKNAISSAVIIYRSPSLLIKEDGFDKKNH